MNTQHEKKLDAALAKLPRSIEPKHDLWPGIHAQITQHRSPRGSWGYGLATAALLVIGVTVVWINLDRHTPVPGNEFTTVVPSTNFTPAGPADLHAQFVAQLASDANMPPRARAALVDNLRSIHGEIARAQLAVKKYPSDVNLQALLLDLYQQEARLMNEAQQTQIQTTTRTSI
jgi:hypothetical protein